MRRKIIIAFSIALLSLAALLAVASASVTNTRITSGPSGVIGTNSATFTFESPEVGLGEHTGFQCRFDSQDRADWHWCHSPKTYDSLADGAHTFEVRAVHGGHPDPTPSVAKFSVQTDPPDTTITDGPSGTITTDQAAFAFQATQPGSFECSLDSAAWAACTSPSTYDSLADGLHTFEVRAVNQFGKADPTPALADFTVKAEPPDTSITDGPKGTITANQATFAFTATQPGSFECSLDSAAWATCSSPKTYHPLADGPHAFEVRAVNEFEKADPTPATVSFTVNTPKPVAAAGPNGPVAGESFNLELVEGTVDLVCPGESDISRLKDFKQIPMGCLINTRNGTVNLAASKGSSGEDQSAHFWGGVFIATQPPGDNQKVELKLAGKRMCERRGGAKGSATISSSKRGGGRKLWGSGKGNYKTSGSYGSATVVGTTWLVVDRCDASTLFRVAEGTVWVRDLIKNKLIVLKPGDQYIAKAAIPRLDPDLWH